MSWDARWSDRAKSLRRWEEPKAWKEGEAEGTRGSQTGSSLPGEGKMSHGAGAGRGEGGAGENSSGALGGAKCCVVCIADSLLSAWRGHQSPPGAPFTPIAQ